MRRCRRCLGERVMAACLDTCAVLRWDEAPLLPKDTDSDTSESAAAAAAATTSSSSSHRDDDAKSAKERTTTKTKTTTTTKKDTERRIEIRRAHHHDGAAERFGRSCDATAPVVAVGRRAEDEAAVVGRTTGLSAAGGANDDRQGDGEGDAGDATRNQISAASGARVGVGA